VGEGRQGINVLCCDAMKKRNENKCSLMIKVEKKICSLSYLINISHSFCFSNLCASYFISALRISFFILCSSILKTGKMIMLCKDQKR
jgi:hypothetical protein